MSADSPRHVRLGGPLTVPSQPPSDRSIIDAVSGFINDVTLSSSSTVDPKDVIQWARFETADINEPTSEGDCDSDVSPLLLILGYGAGVQVWLIPPSGEAQEVLSWRQGIVRVLRILPTPQHGDCFASKRPLIALCDSASPGPSFCSLSFISIRGGEQVKSIKFKNPVLDVLANKRSVVISFTERFAVFDAATLEDRVSVTTCYPCPCPLGGSLPINPITLGDRWLAYADKKLNQSKRSSGGCEGEGVSSYTATVLHAAKSLSKGLRGLGETVAHSLAGRSTSQSPSPPNTDIQQPGVVTIMDIEGNEEEDGQEEEPSDPIVAHFVAHSEAIIALKFDPSGMLLVTADRRGHDFHVFRINPHPCGPSLASVHHLYILHRGDTTAKVQDIAISCDSRWTAVSTLRGTTHVFAISPYGGVCGVRTHTAPRVVNRLSRFHRSAGLPIHTAAKRASPSTVVDSMAQGAWYPNPRLPPYPTPVTVSPLAQLRPTANLPTHTITRTSSGRQRLSSLSEDSNAVPLLARARFGPPSPSVSTSATRNVAPVAALYLMAANGALLHLLLHPKALSSIPKEKISDESGIELEVSAVAQWPLQRPAAAGDLLAPLPPSNPLLQPQTSPRYADICMSEEERWLSQVEIVTHAGPHRRLWMGPQFVFKTYNSTGSNSSLSEAETVEVDAGGVARSNPVNMPGVRPVVPILIDSGSASSLEHSPSDSFRRKSLLAESGRTPSVCDVQLREDLAEAMKEDHGAAIVSSRDPWCTERAWTVDPLGCVAQPTPAPPGSPPDAEPYATSNCDEATFRPVLRAPAPPPCRAEQAARPLPATTTIPVQSVASHHAHHPHQPPPAASQPLSTDVVIPAALSDPRADVSEDARRSAVAPQGPPAPLPKSTRPDDIHPAAESRFRSSPTPKSSVRVDDFSDKDSESRVSGGSRSRDFGESARASESDVSRRREREAPLVVSKIKNVKPEVNRGENFKIVESASTAKIDKTAKPAGVSGEKVKKIEPVLKDSAFGRSAKQVISGNVSLEIASKEQAFKEFAVEKNVLKEPIGKKIVSEQSIKKELVVEPETKLEHPSVPISSKGAVRKKTPEKTKERAKKELILAADNALDKPVSVSLRAFLRGEPFEPRTKKETEKINVLKDLKDDKKAEDLAWDMLLNEPENPMIHNPLPLADDKIEAKPKKARKIKKLQDDSHGKEEEDTFVEIHTIEDKQQQHSSELVSISTPYEEIEPISYFTKATKTRSSKSVTPERMSSFAVSDNWGLEIEPTAAPKYKKSDVADIEFVPDNAKPKNKDSETLKVDTLSVSDIEPVSTFTIREFKPKKAKSLSPYADRKSEKSYENEVKDVYVIDTMKDDFPEIQITKGKSRKKSPQPEKPKEEEIVEIPIIKSWSTIAASKIDNKKEENFKETVVVEKKQDDKDIKVEEELEVEKVVEDEEEAAEFCADLQEMLIQKLLCKRPDIMVAKCDEPTELNFVDEHHSIADLPPLEPKDFVLDEFKLAVMRDSLIDDSDTKVENPICKNIEDITCDTSEAVESGAFNLVDLEKMPLTKEQGFNVVENDKITTQEVKMDDVKPDLQVTENTDDDITPPVGVTDKDKDERKSTGAYNVYLPSYKQSSKYKNKPRKKKK